MDYCFGNDYHNHRPISYGLKYILWQELPPIACDYYVNKDNKLKCIKQSHTLPVLKWRITTRHLPYYLEQDMHMLRSQSDRFGVKLSSSTQTHRFRWRSRSDLNSSWCSSSIRTNNQPIALASSGVNEVRTWGPLARHVRPISNHFELTTNMAPTIHILITCAPYPNLKQFFVYIYYHR